MARRKTKALKKTKQESSCTPEPNIGNQVVPGTARFERSTYEAYGAALLGIVLAVLQAQRAHAVGIIVFGILVGHLGSGNTRRQRTRVLVIALVVLLTTGFLVYRWREDSRSRFTLHVRYQSPDSFNLIQRQQIEGRLNEYHDRLAQLGIPVSQISPLVALTGDVHPGSTESLSPTERLSYISVSTGNSNIIDAIGVAYISISLARYLGMSQGLDYPFIYERFATYFDSSFRKSRDGIYFREPVSTALLKVQETLGSEWTDQVVANTIIVMHEDPPPQSLSMEGVPIPNYSELSPAYLFQHLAAAEASMDADRSKAQRFKAILEMNGIR